MAEYKLLQEEAYNYIRDQILTGTFEKGQIYSEAKIGALLGISRTPVKDALVRLSQEKLIDILPSRGFRLHEVSREDIWGTYQLRAAVEGFCALHLARARDTDVGRACLNVLQSSNDRLEQLLHEEDTLAFWAEDLAFHNHLVEFSGNREFINLLESYHYRMSVIAKRSFESPNRRQEALQEHRAIVEAIRSCTGHKDLSAYAAVQDHMEACRDLVLLGWGNR